MIADGDQYYKDFDNWNKKKKWLDQNKHLVPLFKERDIWWISMGVNVGFEEDGKHDNFVRPVLVIKNSVECYF